MMLTVCWVKVAVHPWSHSCPMESNECGVKSGNMCAWLAVSGRCGNFKMVVPCDCMVLPLGR